MKIVIFTGAGLSAPSGIKTFRGSGGLWENHNINEICNEGTWKKNFDSVHTFYNARRKQMNSVEPNHAHRRLAELQSKYPDEVVLITQNVDNLLEKSGCKNVLHVHGELNKMECTACGIDAWDIGDRDWDQKTERCPKCNSRKGIKPFVVLFGGVAPMYFQMGKELEEVAMDNDSILVVLGTQGNVVPIASGICYFLDPYSPFSFRNAKKTINAHTILNNMEANHDSLPEVLFDEIYYESCETAIDKIIASIENKMRE